MPRSLFRYVTSTGPISICVDASSWQTYRGGVLKHGGEMIDKNFVHCVYAVGIDFEQGAWKGLRRELKASSKSVVTSASESA